MKQNVGGLDKQIRIILGVVIILAGIIFNSWWGVVGIVPLLTGFINWCPVYLPFNISTKKKDTK